MGSPEGLYYLNPHVGRPVIDIQGRINVIRVTRGFEVDLVSHTSQVIEEHFCRVHHFRFCVRPVGVKFLGCRVVVGNMDQSTKEKLNAAFRAMKKQGLVARQSYGTGPWARVDLFVKLLGSVPEDRKVGVVGLVYYPLQEKRRSLFPLNEGRLYVYYSTAFGCPNRKPDVEVGCMVYEALKGAGLRVQWDGSDETAVEVELTGV